MLQPTETHCQRSASSGRAFSRAHLTLAVRGLNRQPQLLLSSVPQTELPMFYKPLHPQRVYKTGFCGPGSLGTSHSQSLSKSINGVLKALQSPAEEDSLALLHTCVKLL